MPPINPLRGAQLNEVTRDVELRPDDIDFLQFHLREVAAACLLSTLPSETYLELGGGRLSPTHALACNVSLADKSIREGSTLNVADRATGKQLSWIKDTHTGIWRVMTSDNVPVTNLGVENKLREINPEIVPAHTLPVGKEVPDDSLFWTISDNIQQSRHRIVSSIFSILDVRGDTMTFSPRHARLISSTKTVSEKSQRTISRNLSIERWIRIEVEREVEKEGKKVTIPYPVDTGYQLINTSAGKRSETTIGKILFQSDPAFDDLQRLAWADDAVPSSRDFTMSIMHILDDFKKQTELNRLG